uniref:Uncharacterized protein n=1 Tax=Aegilops tauschii subsp. strangulata TaxID=200361 RepID=A0A453KAR8_AEGTS
RRCGAPARRRRGSGTIRLRWPRGRSYRWRGNCHSGRWQLRYRPPALPGSRETREGCRQRCRPFRGQWRPRHRPPALPRNRVGREEGLIWATPLQHGLGGQVLNNGQTTNMYCRS